MGSETIDAAAAAMPKSTAPLDDPISVSPKSTAPLVDSFFPEVVSQLPALVDRLSQEFIQCRRNLKFCEAALDIEKVEKGRWENLYRELFSKLHIEQSEKTEARMFELERKLGEVIKNLRDENETLKQKMMEMKKKLEEESILNMNLRDDLKSKSLGNIITMNEKLTVQERESNKGLLGAPESMKDLKDHKNETSEQKIMELKEQLDLKSKSLEDVTLENETLIVKARQSNEELLDARRELISGITDIMSGYNINIGVKRMGELDKTAVIKSCTERSKKVISVTVFENLQNLLKDPSWHPFQIVKDDSGIHREILNEDDKMLQSIKQKYLGVPETLKELLIEYNASGHLPVPELWNFKENRKATPKEAIHCVFEQMKKLTKNAKS